MRAEERARTEREGSSFFLEYEPSWADVVFLSSREKLDLEVADLADHQICRVVNRGSKWMEREVAA